MFQYKNKITLAGKVGQVIKSLKGNVTRFSLRTESCDGLCVRTVWHDIIVSCGCPDLQREDPVEIEGTLIREIYFSPAENEEKTLYSVKALKIKKYEDE